MPANHSRKDPNKTPCLGTDAVLEVRAFCIAPIYVLHAQARCCTPSGDIARGVAAEAVVRLGELMSELIVDTGPARISTRPKMSKLRY